MIMKQTTAIGRAMDAVRDSNLLEATRLIQQALQMKQIYTYQPPTPQPELPNPQEIEHAQGDLAGLQRQQQRTGLAETIAALRALKMPDNAKWHHPENDIPESANFLRRRFTCSVGQRDFRLFVPSKPKPSGLVIMLHGCKQTAEDFAVGTNMNMIAEEHDLLVAYPYQPFSANPSSCWNWFRPQDQLPLGGEAEILAGLTRSLVTEFGLPLNSAFVAGLSAGGAMAAVLGATYSNLYSAVGVHSGLAYRSANDVNTAFAAMRGQQNLRPGAQQFLPRLIIFHGSADQTVNPVNAKALWNDAVRSKGHGEVLDTRVTAGGRTVGRRIFSTPTDVASVEEWIIAGSGHSWSGGNRQGSYTDSAGPDASAEMVRFFLEPLRAISIACPSS